MDHNRSMDNKEKLQKVCQSENVFNQNSHGNHQPGPK